MKKINPTFDIDSADSIVEELQKNPLLKDYLVTEENANLMYQMLNSFKGCKGCKGLEHCPLNVKGFNLVYDKDKKELVARACKFKVNEQEREKSSELFDALFLPENVMKASLEDFDLDRPNRKGAYNIVTNFITNVDNSKTGFGLIGDFSTGKTYLLAAVANELTKKGKSVVLAYFPDLVRSIKNSLNDSARLEAILNKLKTVDVLMLDDLGSENMTAWLRDEILGPIITYRYASEKPMCISSNLSLEDLTNHLSKTSDSYDSVKGTRIMNKLIAVTGKFVNLKK